MHFAALSRYAATTSPLDIQLPRRTHIPRNKPRVRLFVPQRTILLRATRFAGFASAKRAKQDALQDWG
jgi:hypothetical protein